MQDEDSGLSQVWLELVMSRAPYPEFPLWYTGCELTELVGHTLELM